MDDVVLVDVYDVDGGWEQPFPSQHRELGRMAADHLRTLGKRLDQQARVNNNFCLIGHRSRRDAQYSVWR